MNYMGSGPIWCRSATWRVPVTRDTRSGRRNQAGKKSGMAGGAFGTGPPFKRSSMTECTCVSLITRIDVSAPGFRVSHVGNVTAGRFTTGSQGTYTPIKTRVTPRSTRCTVTVLAYYQINLRRRAMKIEGDGMNNRAGTVAARVALPQTCLIEAIDFGHSAIQSGSMAATTIVGIRPICGAVSSQPVSRVFSDGIELRRL